MPLVVKDRVRETSTTAGTGTFTLAGAVLGYQSFSAIGDGNTTYYTIYLQGGNEWEVGIGTYTASGTTLSRDTILSSSNAGSAVNFSAGVKDVFVTYPAGRSVWYDSATNVTLNALTLSGGTQNGVLYLNASRVATSGSALTFDGTTLVSGTGIRANSFMEIRSNTAAMYWENATNTLYWAQNLTGSDFTWTYFNGGSVSEQMRLTSTGLTLRQAGTPANTSVSLNTTIQNALTLEADGDLLVGTTTNTNSSKLVASGTISETVSSTQYLVASQFDIGTAANEIPLNQYLGNLAYQDAGSIAGPVGLGGDVTLYAGTANGVAFLNGSKVLTSGSALTFDGTNLLQVSSAAGKLRLGVNTSDQFLDIYRDNPTGASVYNAAQGSGFGFHVWQVAGSEVARLTSTGLTVEQGAVFNESGADADFRVESDSSTHALFVDAGNSYVGINNSSPVAPLSITSAADGSPTLTTSYTRLYTFTGTVLENNNYQIFKVTVNNIRVNALLRISLQSENTAGIGRPVGSIMEVSVSRVDGGAAFNVKSVSDGNISLSEPVVSGNDIIFGAFNSNNGTGISINYACSVELVSVNPGSFVFTDIAPGTAHTGANWIDQTRIYRGSSIPELLMLAGETVFNENGNDQDFRVESDLNTHMLFVDGGNDAVGIGMIPLTTFGNRNSLEIGGNTVANLSLQAAIGETLYNFYINGSGQSIYSNDGPAGFQSFNNAVSAGWSFQTYPSGTAGGAAPASTDLLALSPNGTIFNEGGADIDFRVESDTDTHCLFVDASANHVGIGTNTPGWKFEVNGSAGVKTNNANAAEFHVHNSSASARDWVLISSGSSWAGGGQTGYFNIYDNTAGAQRLTIDTSGNVGIGTTSPLATQRGLDVSSGGLSFITGADNNTSTRTNNAVKTARIGSAHYTNAEEPMAMMVADSTATENVVYIGGSTSLLNAATIITFFTAANNTTTTGTERARITSGGYFKASNNGAYIGPTGAYHELRSSAESADIVVISSSAAIPYGIQVNFTAATPDNNTSRFLTCQDQTAERCIIYSDGDLANHDGVYGTISDQKLKQDIVDAGSQWNDLKAIRFRKYRMKSDVAANPDAPALLGVVAQELEQVSPGLVDEHPDMETVEVTDEDGNVTQTQQPTGTTTKTVKSSILLMKAAVALQEAMARIEKLEAEVAALKGA